MDNNNPLLASQIAHSDSPLKIINSIFLSARIPIEISIGSDRQIFASKNGCPKYSIVELSDGEKNALLMCIEIITARSQTLIVIDEPELHLHPSISSPLLMELFSKRPDCSYVISTHDLELLGDSMVEKIIVTRDCQWSSGEAIRWDANIIESPKDIDHRVKSSIKGGRKNILFVEGNDSGRDISIYNILFPTVAVIACGNCSDVINAVKGINGVEDLTWLNAMGLIDSDGHDAQKIADLEVEDIFALPSYAIESLYYSEKILTSVLLEVMPQNDVNNKLKEMVNLITSKATELKKELCGYLCEKRAREILITKFPKKKEIMLGGEMQEISIDFDSLITEEYKVFDSLIANDVFGILNRYKIRFITKNLAVSCGYKDSKSFEMKVRAKLRNDPALHDAVKYNLGKISYKIDAL